MRRLLGLTLPLLILGCDGDSGPGTSGTARRPLSPEALVPATTGAPAIRQMRQTWFEEVERLEREVAQGRIPERRFVDLARRGVAELMRATEMAVALEARQAVQQELTSLRTRQADVEKRKIDVSEGMREISTFLDEIERGIGTPPEGFTADELKDRLGEFQERARALEKEDAEIRAEMKRREDLLALEKVPPQGESQLGHELEAARQLEARVAELETRVK